MLASMRPHMGSAAPRQGLQAKSALGQSATVLAPAPRRVACSAIRKLPSPRLSFRGARAGPKSPAEVELPPAQKPAAPVAAAVPGAPPPKPVNKRFQVSVDFGTARSGFAYQTIGPQGSTPVPMVVLGYPRVPSCLPAYPKTLTALLYELDEASGKWAAVDWGWPARDSMVRKLQASSDNGADVMAKYKLVERFKLGLCGDPAKYDAAAELPEGVTAQQATIDYLRFLIGFALAELSTVAAQHGSGAGAAQQVSAAEVQWCMTVPSAWPHTADMRACALAAGMIAERDSPSLEVRHEGEAAAVYAHHDLVDEMHLGERMFVMDMGGGTTDMAVMQLDKDAHGTATLKEPTYRHGELVGAANMDEAFDLWLDARLGGEGPFADEQGRLLTRQHPFMRWCRKDVPSYMELKAEWEVAKIAYQGLEHSALPSWEAPADDVTSPSSGGASSKATAGDGGDAEDEEDAAMAGVAEAAARALEQARQQVATSVPLPLSLAMRKAKPDFAARLGLPAGATVQQALGALQGGVDHVIELTYADMDDIFSVVLTPALKAAQDMVQRCGGRVDKLVLAGGLGGSRHVQRVVSREMRGVAGQVLVPRNAGSAVLEGGLLALAKPGAVSERRAAMTYGERFTDAWREGAPDKEALRGRDGFFTRNRFEVFVHKNDPIRPDQVVSRTFFPTVKNQESVSIELWATPNPAGATYTTEPGCVKLVDELLPLDPERVIDLNSYRIQCDMHFGRAEVTLRAKDVQTGRELHIVAGLDAMPAPPKAVGQ